MRHILRRSKDRKRRRRPTHPHRLEPLRYSRYEDRIPLRLPILLVAAVIRQTSDSACVLPSYMTLLNSVHSLSLSEGYVLEDQWLANHEDLKATVNVRVEAQAWSGTASRRLS